MTVDVYPRDDQHRYRIYALRDGELNVLATSPDPGGIGAAIVGLDQDEREAHPPDGYLGDRGAIGVLDAVEGRWIIKPWHRREQYPTTPTPKTRERRAVVAKTETIGKRLRRLREEQGMSQRELAVPGVTYAYISRIEAGSRQPSVRALRKLAPRLGVSAVYLETGRDTIGEALASLRAARTAIDSYRRKANGGATAGRSRLLGEAITEIDEAFNLIESTL